MNIRPIALSGLDIVSPVFCRSRLASSEMEGVEMARGLADSSPAWGDGRSLIPRTFASAKGVAGECGSEGGRLWIANSTFLQDSISSKILANVDHLYFSNSSWVTPDNDVWSIVSMKETAAIYL